LRGFGDADGRREVEFDLFGRSIISDDSGDEFGDGLMERVTDAGSEGMAEGVEE
jgi:hypothetical protein